MLSKKLMVISVLAILLVATLVTDGEAAIARKDDKVDQKSVGAPVDGSKKVSHVRDSAGFYDYDDPGEGP